MNILIVCDNFSKGGLETHIYSYYKELLKKNNKVYFAFGKIENPSIFDNVHSNFNFYYSTTIKELIDDVERLVEIIINNNIEIIHVHPWYGLMPAVFAAAKTKTKLFYTAHGNGSVNFCYNIYNQLIFEYILSDVVTNNFCVGLLPKNVLTSLGINNSTLLLNPIDSNLFKNANIENNKKWALVSRLDEDKVDVIKNIFKIYNQININEIDIYGDGKCFDDILNLSKNCKKPINLMGHIDDLYERLSSGYNGVIGIGRCVLEGLAMGLPVLFAGYGKIIGIIDDELYDKANKTNFVPLNFPEISIDELNVQLSNCYKKVNNNSIRDKAIKDHDISLLTDKLIEHYNNDFENVNFDSICSVYDKIICIDDNRMLNDNIDVFLLFADYLGIYSKNGTLRDKFISNKEFLLKTNNNKYEIQGINDKLAVIESIQNRIDLLEKTSNNLINETNNNLIKETEKNASFEERITDLYNQVSILKEENKLLKNRTIGFYVKDWIKRHFSKSK